jgi:outer membrane receptor for ferrienterochelin and colicin
LKYEIGIRAEQTSNNGKSNSDTTSFSNNYLHFFPSANLAYYVHDDDFFKYSFSRRINRPGLGQLNPFIDITDSLNPHGGNPFLKPELINSIELGYNKEWHHFSATSTLFYRYATDIIRPFVSVDSHGVALALPMNYGNATTYGFEEICSISPIRWYGCNASISFYEQRIDGSNVSTDALSNYFSWYLKTIHNFSLGKGCRLQCIANYNSPIATPQGTRIAVYNADLGLQKKFKNQASALGIVLTDIFNTQKNGFTAVNSTFNFHRTSKADTRAVLITAVKEDMLENKFENE